MDLRILFSAILSINFVLCEDLLPKPCPVEDTECLNQATETFLEKTSAGIPAFDIFPLDPLLIPMVDAGGNQYKVTLRNIEVKGLKHQKISNFKLDQAAKSVILTTKANLTIDADYIIEIPSLKKGLSGRYSAKASPLGTAKYSYSIVKDDAGVEHFAVGPETTTCVVGDEAVESLDEELTRSLTSDPKITEMRDKENPSVFCKVVEVAYITVVHNIRAAAKVLPKSAFFTNVNQ